MGKVIFGFLVVIGLLLAALAIAPFLIPQDVYRAQLTAAAERALGREVAVDGDLSLSLLPTLQARAGVLRVANPEGFTEAHFLTAERFAAGVKILPLLSGRVEVAELVLTRPSLSLERRADGAVNWSFGAPAEAGSEPGSAPDGEAPAPSGPPDAASFDASLGDIRLVDGRVRYIDAVEGVDREITHADVTVSLPSLDRPARLDLGLKVDGERLDARLDVEKPRAILDGQETVLALTLGGDLVEGGVQGRAAIGDDPEGDFTFDVAITDAERLIALAGLDAPPAGLVQALNAAGSARIIGDQITVSDLTVRARAPQLEADYMGGAQINGAVVRLDGEARAEMGDLEALLGELPVDPPPPGVLRQLNFEGGVSGPLDALAIRDAQAELASDLLAATYSGGLQVRNETLTFDGAVEIGSGQLRALATALGAVIPETSGPVFNTLDITGRLSGDQTALAFEQAEIALDDLRANGRLAVNLAGSRPRLDGRLDLAAADLSPYLGEPETTASGGVAPWSTDPLDLSGLGAVDASLALSVEGLRVRDLAIGAGAMTVTLQDRALNIDMPELGLYGGQVAGQFGLNARSEAPQMTLAVNMDDVQAQGLLSAVAKFDRLSGVGTAKLDVTGRGASQAALMRSLSGSGGFDFVDGEVTGVNFTQIAAVRTQLADVNILDLGKVAAALSTSEAREALSSNARTDFSEFQGTFTIANGVARTDDLAVAAPGVRVTGEGELDIGGQSADLRLRPRIVASADTQAERDGGLVVPLRIAGPWNGISPSLDQQAVVQSLTQSSAVREQAGALIGQALGLERLEPAANGETSTQSSAAGSLATGLLNALTQGGDQDAPAAEPTDEPAVDDADAPEPSVEQQAVEALGALFNRRRTREPEPSDDPPPQ
ncbi:MAG: AsmA family protein [Maricaulaceae bacterium]